MEMSQYLDIFFEESREHLQSMNENLLNLEKNPEDLPLINEIFRIAHTLKGMSGTMGFSRTANLTHEMENLLHSIRSGELKITSYIINVLFKCFDALEDIITYIGANGSENEAINDELINQIRMIVNNKEIENNEISITNNKEDNYNEYIMNIIVKAKENNMNIFKIRVLLSEECMLKSARAFIIFNTLESHSEIIHSVPSVEDIEDEKFNSSFELTLVSKLEQDSIYKELMSISEIKKIEVFPVNLDSFNLEEMDQSSKLDQTDNRNQDESNTNVQNKKNHTGKMGKTVRVDIDRLDNLMNLVSELIIIKTRMEDTSESQDRENMNDAIEYLERITTNLHDAVMKVRMVPIERVFNRFPRMVRDVSKELGKEINLEMSGEETEVDRTVIDEIGDPLIHLIRNSIDHGIESPEKRKESGKNDMGTVKLKAYPDGNNVVIEVEDDGDGIDIEKVRIKSVQRGLISEERANDLSKDEVVELLFRAGFSTSDVISDISGRGVGLDVVKTKIESIGGLVEVETHKGKGTKFIIRLPLTLAIIQALLIRLQKEIYAIPLNSIGEISTINRSQIRKVQNQEVVLFRNKTLPLIYLGDVLGLNISKESEDMTIVIVKKGDKEAGLIVDNLIGQQEIVIKSLGKYLAGIKHLAGATILGNGQISLILDVNSLF